MAPAFRIRGGGGSEPELEGTAAAPASAPVPPPCIRAVMHDQAASRGAQAFLQAWASDSGLELTLTFADFSQRVTAAEAVLISKGVARGTRVAMLSQATVPFFIYSLGVINAGGVAVVLSWLEGKKFHEVMAQCDLYEGSVVRAIRRLEELAREIVVAAKTIGNHDLEGKMLEARGKLKRGIIFAASLYL